MQIRVDRVQRNANQTLSKIYVDDRFVWIGLEEGQRAKKVAGRTRIPAGTYKIKSREHGGLYQLYCESPNYSKFHRGMLEIEDVPDFTDILIHTGETDKGTEGSLLVGASYQTGAYGGVKLLNSREGYKRLYRKVIDAAEKGELLITFTDSDR